MNRQFCCGRHANRAGQSLPIGSKLRDAARVESSSGQDAENCAIHSVGGAKTESFQRLRLVSGPKTLDFQKTDSVFPLSFAFFSADFRLIRRQIEMRLPCI